LVHLGVVAAVPFEVEAGNTVSARRAVRG
jgi:hypothetical protein